MHRSGFVGIIGRPNVGKSTIVNHYLGEKIAIVSPRPQTTRQRILGVVTRQDAQVMFLDTPGLHAPEHALGRYMLEVTKSVMDEVDVLVTVIDARSGITDDDEQVFSRVKQLWRGGSGGSLRGPVLLALNKVDLVKKPRLLPILETLARRRLFTECVPISAVTGDQMEMLLQRIIANLPEGPRWYELEQHTDQPLGQRIGELIREQVLIATRAEVPHAVAVLIEDLQESPSLMSIQATILVERQGQKAIVIGRGGQMLKHIGQEARRQIERLVGRKVYLGLWVKVAEGWRSDEGMLRRLGYAGMG